MASDHAGFELKETVKSWLEAEGHEVEDVGTFSEESTDYPPFAAQAARLVAGQRGATAATARLVLGRVPPPARVADPSADHP